MKNFNLIALVVLTFGCAAWGEDRPAPSFPEMRPVETPSKAPAKSKAKAKPAPAPTVSDSAPEAVPAPAPAPVFTQPTGGESVVSRLRSKSDKYLWLYGNAGVQAGWWGVNTGGGVGGRHGVGARLMFGRCGGVAEWTTEHMDYYHPDPSSNMRVLGAGVACTMGGFDKRAFWRGSHFVVRLMGEYATNEYEIHGYMDRFVAAGRTYGGGGVLGADFHIPIFVGFWAFAGTGVEVLKFKYNIPDNPDSIRDGGDPTVSFFIRAGLAYAPF